MSRNVLRYSLLLAPIMGEFEYDPAKPATYTAALQSLADLRAKLAAAGVTVTRESAKPVSVKAKS